MHVDFMHHLLDVSQNISMHYFRSEDLCVDTKSDASPVSVADKKSETAIRESIRKAYPHHGIIGEEFGTENVGASPYTWIIDPIDGTRAFIAGRDTFANMVCLLENNRPILSGIGFPAKSERYMAYDGKTTRNDVIIHVDTHVDIASAKTCHSGLHMFNDTQRVYLGAVMDATHDVLETGDAYNYCRLCAGDNLVVCEADLQPYDFLPVQLMVQNAGGTITDWQGKDLTMDSIGEVLATPCNHAQIIQILQDIHVS